MQFVDRFLKCSDCGKDFVFTAGEQIFFFDKQFKNDPKRCKLCQARRAGLGKPGKTGALTKLPFSRTETRTECSACGIETTVPFKPTQGRPVLCRSCFQLNRVPPAVAAVAALESPVAQAAITETAAEAALATMLTGGSAPAAASASSAATMELIAQVPAAALMEHDTGTATELVASSADAPSASAFRAD